MFSASSEVPKDDAPERRSATSKNDSTKSFPMLFEDAEVVNVALLLLESVCVFSFFVFSLETNNLFDDDDENDDNDEEVAPRNILYIYMSVGQSVNLFLFYSRARVFASNDALEWKILHFFQAETQSEDEE